MHTKLTKIFAIALMSMLVGGIAAAHPRRTIEPIVSTEWLAAHLSDSNLIVLDVRSAESYGEGHIPGALNEPFEVPFSAWITMRDDLLLEVPDTEDLFASLGALGITAQSQVIVLSDPNPDEPPFYGLSAATRVADTLIYAGVSNVAVLSGGYTLWVAESRPVETAAAAPVPAVFDGRVRQDIFVSSEYTEAHLHRARILDARDADVYFGMTVEVYAAKAGHIPTASSFPAPWIWETSDDTVYTVKDVEQLAQAARGILGTPREGGMHRHFYRDIIVYCGVGGYASALWFVLSEVLKYPMVRFFDGSAQEWVRDREMRAFRWE